MNPVDYFDAKQARERLEAALNKHIISPDREDCSGGSGFMPARDHVVDLSPKESLADFVLRRRAELEKQQEELSFLQDVAELMRKHPKFFESGK